MKKLSFLLVYFLTTSLFASVLIKGTHHTILSLKAGKSVTSVWLPLPMNYETQVPLSLNLTVTPTTAQPIIEYDKDDIGNFGAWIRFAPHTQETEVAIHIEYLVLTHDQLIDQKDRSDFYLNLENRSEWAVSTPIVSSDYPDIKATALKIAQESNSSNFLSKLLEYNKNELTYGSPQPFSLDSITAYQQKKTTCTGYANLTAAFGRAAGVSTRTLAGYLVGMVQDTRFKLLLNHRKHFGR